MRRESEREKIPSVVVGVGRAPSMGEGSREALAIGCGVLEWSRSEVSISVGMMLPGSTPTSGLLVSGDSASFSPLPPVLSRGESSLGVLGVGECAGCRLGDSG